MKYAALLVTLAIVYWMFVRVSPLAEVTESMAAPELAPLTSQPEAPALPPTNALKRPLDRTHQVLEQVGQRNDADNL